MPPPTIANATLAAPAPLATAPPASHGRATMALLNVAHALDHLVLLVFATAVGAIAIDFGFARWEDLMPYATGSFLLFGLGSVPAGRLGEAAEVASLVSYLMSDGAAYITRQVISVNGGMC